MALEELARLIADHLWQVSVCRRIGSSRGRKVGKLRDSRAEVSRLRT